MFNRKVIANISVLLIMFVTLHSDYLVCPMGYSTDYNPRLALNRSCVTNKDCDDRAAFCTMDRRCQCFLGYAPKFINDHFYCRQKLCSSNDECHYFFGQNIACEDRHCQCPLGYVFVEDRCITKALKIGAYCDFKTSVAQAGPVAVCNENNSVVCQIGAYKVNPVACRHSYCKNDADCERLHENTICLSALKFCRCKNGFHENDINSACLKGKRRDESCISINECGSNVICGHGFCICQFGFRPASDFSNCEKIHCKNDEDCKAYDLNAFCHLKANQTCQCRKDKILNQNTQACVDIAFGGDPFPFLAIILIIILSGLVLFTFSLFLYTKRPLIYEYFNRRL